MGRRPCCSKQGLNRGLWSAKEDRILTNYIKVHGEGKWRDLPQRAGLKRCGKSCRLRWLNYLKPDIKRGNISEEEEELIIRLHKLLGNRWSLIAGRLPGRTDNEIKNYWNSNISKRVHGNKSSQGTKKQLVDPVKEKSEELGHKVIRTKAVRCTKIVNIPEVMAPLEIRDNNNILEGYINSTFEGSQSYDFSFGLRDDILMNLDVDDVLLPDLDPNQVNYEEGGDIIPYSLDFPNLEKCDANDRIDVLEDITKASSRFPCQLNDGAFDLDSLTRFLISEEEWPRL